MLLELHVRNFALIEKADLEFKSGLTVLSGETGAGKSILIDSIAAALGAKAGKDVIRTGAESAYIELIFSVTGKEKLEKIRDLGLEPADENGTFIVSRKILPARSIMRINDEAVTAATLRSMTGLLIDIHGQHEHQTLLNPSAHLKFIDLMSPPEILDLKRNTAEIYGKYSSVRKLLLENTDESIRLRETEILQYETEEIEKADLKEGEEEKLHSEYTKMRNAARITDALSRAAQALDTDAVSTACRAVSEIADYAPELKALESQLSELDGLLSDAGRSTEACSENLEFSEEHFSELNARLDVIHRLQDKYGNDIGGILKLCAEKKERLEFLKHFGEKQAELKKQERDLRERLEKCCGSLTEIRKKTAGTLKRRISEQLASLNFEGADFDIVFSEQAEPGPNGKDRAEFLICTNPGEPLKPLKDIASGGELSRVMLALKTVLADTDETDTLIFDEIDAGISGRTAQKVSEKLSLIGKKRQVLCITHLPQIAAMADHHLLIRKSTFSGGEAGETRTRTDIREIQGEDIREELARLIGGVKITPAVLSTAQEMKELADRTKKAVRKNG